MKNGTVKHSKDIDFVTDERETAERYKKIGINWPVDESVREAGFYVYFGMWKGPFNDAELAKSAYREWAWEAKHS